MSDSSNATSWPCPSCGHSNGSAIHRCANCMAPRPVAPAPVQGSDPPARPSEATEQAIRAYLARHRAKSPYGDLRNALIKAGYAEADIDAVRTLMLEPEANDEPIRAYLAANTGQHAYGDMRNALIRAGYDGAEVDRVRSRIAEEARPPRKGSGIWTFLAWTSIVLAGIGAIGVFASASSAGFPNGNLGWIFLVALNPLTWAAIVAVVYLRRQRVPTPPKPPRHS